jgi:hypothetical protein
MKSVLRPTPILQQHVAPYAYFCVYFQPLPRLTRAQKRPRDFSRGLVASLGFTDLVEKLWVVRAALSSCREKANLQASFLHLSSDSRPQSAAEDTMDQPSTFRAPFAIRLKKQMFSAPQPPVLPSFWKGLLQAQQKHYRFFQAYRPAWVKPKVPKVETRGPVFWRVHQAFAQSALPSGSLYRALSQSSP